jgi:predicted DNA-binding transcriptional regulator YafY
MNIKNNNKNINTNNNETINRNTQTGNVTGPRPPKPVPSSVQPATKRECNQHGERSPACRDALARMKAIHDRIAAKKYPNCTTLHNELEVSRRTLKRDIEYMKNYYCLPIDFDQQRNGYIYTEQVNGFLGAASVTEAELVYFLVAQNAVAQYGGTGLEAALAQAFEKLMGALDAKKRFSVENFHDALCFRPFAPEDIDKTVFKSVSEAITCRQSIKFIYRKPGEKCSMLRHVHPYHLVVGDNRWYIVGWDVHREDIRLFALGRVKELALQDDVFQKRPDFDLKKHFDSSLGVLTGTGDYEVVIEFDAWATDMLRGRKWHSSQEVTELTCGASRMTLRLSALEEVERWILSWGTHATVVRPLSLIHKLYATALALLDRYEPAPVDVN